MTNSSRLPSHLNIPAYIINVVKIYSPPTINFPIHDFLRSNNITFHSIGKNNKRYVLTLFFLISSFFFNFDHYFVLFKNFFERKSLILEILFLFCTCLWKFYFLTNLILIFSERNDYKNGAHMVCS